MLVIFTQISGNITSFSPLPCSLRVLVVSICLRGGTGTVLGPVAKLSELHHLNGVEHREAELSNEDVFIQTDDHLPIDTARHQARQVGGHLQQSKTIVHFYRRQRGEVQRHVIERAENLLQACIGVDAAVVVASATCTHADDVYTGADVRVASATWAYTAVASATLAYAAVASADVISMSAGADARVTSAGAADATRDAVAVLIDLARKGEFVQARVVVGFPVRIFVRRHGASAAVANELRVDATHRQVTSVSVVRSAGWVADNLLDRSRLIHGCVVPQEVLGRSVRDAISLVGL